MGITRLKTSVAKCGLLAAQTIVLATACILLLPVTASAEIFTWTGAASNAWTTVGNWSGNSAPVSGPSNSIDINTSANPAIASGITFSGTQLYIGSAATTAGTLQLINGSNFTTAGAYIGQSGIGALHIVNSALTSSRSVEIGTTGNGHVTIAGANASLSVLEAFTHLNIGNSDGGYGKVEILEGARVSAWNVALGNLSGSGDLIVNGTNSLLTIQGRDLSAAGKTGDVSITVSDGGQINIIGETAAANRGMLQLGSNDDTRTDLLLTGENSQISTTGEARLAEFGTVTATVDDKAVLSVGNKLFVGDGRNNYGSTGTLMINAGAAVNVADDIYVGAGAGGGIGTVTLQGGSTLQSDGAIYLAVGHADTRGALNIGAASGQAARAAGFIDTAEIYFGMGEGRMVFNHTANNVSGAYNLGQTLIGDGFIENHAGLTRLTATDNSTFIGATNIFGGTMWIDTVLGGTMTVGTAGRLQGIGTVGATANSGVIAPGSGGFGALVIDGDYEGQNGWLEINTVLGGDDSPTDMLVVNGNTSGTTNVRVTNRSGLGAATLEGIKIIDVELDSDGLFVLDGDFTLSGGRSAVGAGLYAYTLNQNGIETPDDGNWYLRAELNDDANLPHQPGVGVYEAYPQILLGLNELPTLQQRIGNRSWGKADTGISTDGNGVWGRIDAAHDRTSPRFSTAGIDFDQDRVEFQAGLDGRLHESADGILLGGVNLRYVDGSAQVWSPFDAEEGNGRIKTKGYGIGGTLTWYGESGAYIDGQAGMTWYDSDLSYAGGSRILAEGNNGFGYALSIEGGKRIPMDAQWSLTPQAQLSYSHVTFDNFVDIFDAAVSVHQADSLLGRIGLSADYQNSWRNENSTIDRTHLYGIANLYHEFLDGTEVDVEGKVFANKKERLRAGIGLGGSYNWNDDRYSVYGEGLVTTALRNFGDSYTVKGTLGLRVKWQ